MGRLRIDYESLEEKGKRIDQESSDAGQFSEGPSADEDLSDDGRSSEGADVLWSLYDIPYEKRLEGRQAPSIS